MNRCILFYVVIALQFLYTGFAVAQQKIFKSEVKAGLENAGIITSIAQDHQGYMWIGTLLKGLHRYDGSQLVSFANEPKNINSLADNCAETLVVDAFDNIWIGTRGGLDKYDKLKNKFTHFKHKAGDEGSLINDTVTAMLLDRFGNFWVGTKNGLDLLDTKTGKFTHYVNKLNDPTSLSYNDVRSLVEDRNGTIWVGCGSAFKGDGGRAEDGGLNRFDRTTGKFTRYLHEPGNPNSLENNKVEALLEDSKGNFWVGTAGDGLQTLDRAKGVFTHYYYDSTKPEKLSRPPIYHTDFAQDHISFLHEDAAGFIWIGTYRGGMNQYNPRTKNITHHGVLYKGGEKIFTDTLSGFSSAFAWKACTSKDGLLWITAPIEVFTVHTTPPPVIPYVDIRSAANGFYEANGLLWIGTVNGLVRKDLKTGTEKVYKHSRQIVESLSNDSVNAIVPDNEGKLWLATEGGLNKFDPIKEKFTRYVIDGSKESFSNRINNLYLDQDKILWMATYGGLNKFNIKTGVFKPYKHSPTDSNSISNNDVLCMSNDKDLGFWVGTSGGVNRFDRNTGLFKRYLLTNPVKSLLIDNRKEMWVGAQNGLYRYDRNKDEFLLFSGNSGLTKIKDVLHLLEDDEKNIWVSTTNTIYRIGVDRNTVRVFGKEHGIHKNEFYFSNNYKTNSGKLLLGDHAGYYFFYPKELLISNYPPQINITSFKIGEQEALTSDESTLKGPVYKAEEILLKHFQNSFSIGFSAIQYRSTGEKKFQYMLEKYDNVWHDAGAEKKAYFFNIAPGDYKFRVRAINSDGAWSERELLVVITPPWWRTVWALTFFALLFIGAVWGFFYYRSGRLRKENRLLEEKVNQRTGQLQRSLNELKATQAQLIQSEKMASLGELTAGIAHEIQNPLNFVNNFSDVNREMLEELKAERLKPIAERNESLEANIINDVIENEEKINHHGKRADAIVKGMLQHSRVSNNRKEPTNINSLTDEYLRLAYHGFRSKDKSFNVDLKTEYDESIGSINIVPQDVSRAILNLVNNAFYAVDEKKKQSPENYDPTVSIATKRIRETVEIQIADNGAGIPQNIVDKIFQPFFTTKPTGHGTGLGLSLAYDIIKAHGGELKVHTKEGEGSEFVIVLPNIGV